MQTWEGHFSDRALEDYPYDELDVRAQYKRAKELLGQYNGEFSGTTRYVKFDCLTWLNTRPQGCAYIDCTGQVQYEAITRHANYAGQDELIDWGYIPVSGWAFICEKHYLSHAFFEGLSPRHAKVVLLRYQEDYDESRIIGDMTPWDIGEQMDSWTNKDQQEWLAKKAQWEKK